VRGQGLYDKSRHAFAGAYRCQRQARVGVFWEAKVDTAYRRIQLFASCIFGIFGKLLVHSLALWWCVGYMKTIATTSIVVL
jgi:hypothetical protein